MGDTPDEILIKGCQENDRASQQLLFEKYAQRMMNICLRYTNDVHDAEDLLQEGFIRVFTKIGSFKGGSSIGTWMTRVFINMAINKINRQKRKWQETEYNDSILSVADDDQMPEQVDGQLVLNTLKELPENYRVVLNMYAIDGLNHKEIADLLGISEGGSKSRLSRARVLLKERLKEKGLLG
ncbi:MAG: sigma-70 family RNA polymerase sigma factor [Flavobacteriales bacterium]|nr:sigma-70 family RNA polymerase sigma factor [Flavobacteriales bacterium]